jgi:hypothetical protein
MVTFKKLSDGSLIPSDCYYFLLDWNDKNHFKAMETVSAKTSLYRFNTEEFYKLFSIAIQVEFDKLIKLETSIKSNQNDKYDKICFELDKT